ncbi:5-formyltetrahydrofolate cyclo-ligase [Frankia sp. AgB1.9]|uniref:5-formyltetrahydrofolate cyclo-ligase n=1 Tax=unclassified Frankia TaxID=2632575 RepID=UPI001933979C|nr:MULTISPECIES: 5-formyltetrahydrofolate cyclo-ligase [unclassified Frankia]MBL7491900.1 5-formyltetrahydrofolate cyclo-ligase [Frankia sp. AgW1.1]MBL7550189.1 5-formyltetrahydrofolate cyclo-ligase [Frankia sp. AgB1.9]MBL7619848.1 5-formyltetrahydrofolate cyclo-ligase [Frankia sp. AgB1.8]
MSVETAKQAARIKVWDLLERARAAPLGVHGHIPDFTGSDQAADRLAGLPVWRDATVIKAVPDRAQLPVRARALADGRLLYMAVPRLAAPLPFYELDPATLTVPPDEAASHQAAARLGCPVDVTAMRPVDLMVCGSVAVDVRGVRVGKGAGYTDLEFALLQEAGLITPTTTIATTVHDLQVLDEELPATRHDVSVDLIVTPTQVIACRESHRPAGILWENLADDTIAQIPALITRRAAGRAGADRFEAGPA